MNNLAAQPRREALADRRTSLSTAVYEQILMMIIDKQFAPNARLPSEQDMAQMFNVSRPVLREALARLREDGVLASRQGSGTYVLRKPDKAVFEFAPLSSIVDIQNCFKFRIGIEGEAAHFAALHHNPETLAAIEDAFERMSQEGVMEGVGVNADYEFHLNIAKASENRFFISSLELIKNHIGQGMNIARSLSLRRTKIRKAEVQKEHLEIFMAIKARDAQGAWSAMRSHIENARRRIFEGDIVSL